MKTLKVGDYFENLVDRYYYVFKCEMKLMEKLLVDFKVIILLFCILEYFIKCVYEV